MSPLPPSTPGPAPLARALAEGLGSPSSVDPAALEPLLAALVATASEPWPALAHGAEDFLRHVGACLGSDPGRFPDPWAAVADGTAADALHLPDLWLACACARGRSDALAAFERQHRRDLEAVSRRFAGPGAAPEDLRQILRERLFVATGDRPPRIAEYRGTGTLQAWLRATAVRTFLDEKRRVERHEKDHASAEEALLEHQSGEDWELGYLKARYREVFRAAFLEALGGLPPGHRNLLRHHAVEGLTIDQIAALYALHRSSAARRLKEAREALLAATRAGLEARLKVKGRELESVIALVRSRLDLSLVRALGAGDAGDGAPR